ncbi:MAG TPA: hypothetical protein PKW07_09295 [Syntrophorhabdaceae bacterium]|nr:hypothetical protein [Syntrophorhabdaceae bacterium]
MAKYKMVCPITGGMCVDCAIYRGRHYYLCFSKDYHGTLMDANQIETLKSKNSTKRNETFEMPGEIPLSKGCIKDVEELIERRGL